MEKIAYAEGIEHLEGDQRIAQVKEWRKKYEEENKWILNLKDVNELDSASDNFFEHSYPLVSQIAKGIREGLAFFKENTGEEELEEFIEVCCVIVEIDTYRCSVSMNFDEIQFDYYCDELMMDCLTMLECLEEKKRLVISQETDHWLDDAFPGSETLEEMGLEGLSLEYPC